MNRQLSWLLAVLLLVLCIAPAAAHEGREVGGYILTFGWRSEPAYAGLWNGPEIYLAVHSDSNDSDNIHAAFPADTDVNLQAEVRFGDQTTSLVFRRAWGETGHYVAELIPALPGDYHFHVTGSIGDVLVDEVFSSADGQFSTVEPLSDILFPMLAANEPAAQISALEARIAELEARLSALESGS